MARSETTFSYSDLMACLEVLRGRTDGQPLAYMVALVGEYVVDRDLKTMLRYLAKRGRIKRVARGRDTTYVVHGPQLAEGIVAQKMLKSARHWDEKWNVFTYDVPEHTNTLRRRLGRTLHQMGFAMMSGSSWVSPYDWREELEQALSSWGCEGSFALARCTEVSELGERGGCYPRNLWDIREVEAAYIRVAERCGSAPLGMGAAAQKARARIAVAASKELDLIHDMDPMLPVAVLPANWPRDAALESFRRLASRVDADARQCS